ncbi:lipoprotein [Spiroplasma sp. BIUS-1]|uniref:lipoprotein n=1 Tax=Spiroplasma sp. BIUS-1 TaxID=216964 RepID=UPI001398A58A|nr:lipoprotein [Spiroplasma sp. BIUS-1]QHX36663.1 hypothetical protein SBIUS_v1c04100 [Spiroplasma sp. BIUS-1]
MKKLLGLLAATGLVATTSATVVACGPKNEQSTKEVTLRETKTSENIILINSEIKTGGSVEISDDSIVKISDIKVVNGKVTAKLTAKQITENDQNQKIVITYKNNILTKEEVKSITFEINVKIEKKEISKPDTEIDVQKVKTDIENAVNGKTSKADVETAIKSITQKSNEFTAAITVNEPVTDGEVINEQQPMKIDYSVTLKANKGFKLPAGSDGKISGTVKYSVSKPDTEIDVQKVKTDIEIAVNGKTSKADVETAIKSITQKSNEFIAAITVNEPVTDGEVINEQQPMKIDYSVTLKANKGFKLPAGSDGKISGTVKYSVSKPDTEIDVQKVKTDIEIAVNGKTSKADVETAIKSITQKSNEFTAAITVNEPVTDGEVINEQQPMKIDYSVTLTANKGFKLPAGSDGKISGTVKYSVSKPDTEIDVQKVKTDIENAVNGKTSKADVETAIKSITQKSNEFTAAITVNEPVTDGEVINEQQPMKIDYSVTLKANKGFKLPAGSDGKISGTVKYSVLKPDTEIDVQKVKTDIEIAVNGKTSKADVETAIKSITQKSNEFIAAITVNEPVTNGEVINDQQPMKIDYSVTLTANKGFKLPAGNNGIISGAVEFIV